MPLSRLKHWSSSLEDVCALYPGHISSPTSEVTALRQDKVVGSGTNKWCFFEKVPANYKTRCLLRNFYFTYLKKVCDIPLWQYLIWPNCFHDYPFIIISRLTLTRISMFSHFNTHTECWKRYAAVTMIRTAHLPTKHTYTQTKLPAPAALYYSSAEEFLQYPV